MTHQTAEEAKKRNIDKMGEPLGSQYSALWQEVVQVFMVWSEFVVLYGTKSSRVDLMNRAASSFFYMIQELTFEATMLHIARFTDPPNSSGRKDRANLTIQNLPALIDDTTLKNEVIGLLDTVIKRSEFCRDWRNRHVAHRDLDLALGSGAAPLKAASIQNTNSALSAIADVLNAVQLHFFDGQTAYDFADPPHGARTLLYLLDDGLKAKDARADKIARGEISKDDLQKEI